SPLGLDGVARRAGRLLSKENVMAVRRVAARQQRRQLREPRLLLLRVDVEALQERGGLSADLLGKILQRATERLRGQRLDRRRLVESCYQLLAGLRAAGAFIRGQQLRHLQRPCGADRRYQTIELVVREAGGAERLGGGEPEQRGLLLVHGFAEETEQRRFELRHAWRGGQEG